MERKLKEVNATLDQERTQHVEQRDQVRTPIFCQRVAFASVQNEMYTIAEMTMRSNYVCDFECV